MTAARRAVLGGIADEIEARTSRERPLRVAVDGVDAAGKTTLADELGKLLRSRGREVVRVSADRFLRARVLRYERGRESPEGYYLDSFDHDELRASVRRPLAGAAVLLCDGVFLQRPELDDLWDFRIFVSITPAESLRRGVRREGKRIGSRAEAQRLYERRYLPGQRLYLDAVGPELRADVVVRNDDPARPVLSAAAPRPRAGRG